MPPQTSWLQHFLDSWLSSIMLLANQLGQSGSPFCQLRSSKTAFRPHYGVWLFSCAPKIRGEEASPPPQHGSAKVPAEWIPSYDTSIRMQVQLLDDVFVDAKGACCIRVVGLNLKLCLEEKPVNFPAHVRTVATVRSVSSGLTWCDVRAHTDFF